MSRLFEVTSIRQVKLANRFVRSATYEGMAAGDGTCAPALREKMVELAAGGVGLIVTSHSFVSPEGRARPLQLGIHSDAMIPALRTMTDAVHARNSRIVIQLAHAGAQADPKMTRLAAFGPSPLKKADGTVSRQMVPADFARIKEAFGEAAERAMKAGFDGAQIHAAHGYLLSQFLSPHFNRRTDAYGGSIENRARLLLEVAAIIRARTGEDFVLLVKINSDDFIENGFRVDEMVRVSKMLEAADVDAVEISGGTGSSGDKIPSRIGVPKTEEEEGYYRKAALDFKREVKIPLILVGGIRSLGVAEGLVAEGVADYVALSRPLIREPNLVHRWRSADPSMATCISCNRCYRPILRGEGISCEEDHPPKDGSGGNVP